MHRGRALRMEVMVLAVPAPRWLWSARRRPAAFFALVALSAFTVVVSVLTPMLLESVGTAGLASRIAALRPPDDGVTVTAIVPSTDLLATAESAVDNALGEVGTDSVWGDAVRATVTSGTVKWRLDGSNRSAQRSPVSIVETCSGLRLTAGRCPRTLAEAAIPASAAAAAGLGVGSRVAFQQSQETPMVDRVVGIYDDAHGAGAVLADPDALVGSGLAHPVANPILGAKGVAAITYPLMVEGAVQIDRVVRPTDLPVLRASVAAAKRTALDEAAAQTSAHVVSGLTDVIASFEAQQAAAVTLTAPIALQALGLAWFALAFVMQRTARARALEWGIGRSRGLRRSTWLGTVFLEPGIAIVAGALLGYGAALLIGRAAVAVAVGSSGAIAPTAPFTLAAALLALAGSLVALVVASARSAALPLDALLRDTTEPRGVSRLSLVAQVAAVLAAAAVLWSVLTSRLTDGPQLALALPILMALVAGVVALRVTVVVVQRVAQRPPRSLVALVAGRGLARAPSTLTAAVLVLIAASLAGYSLELDAVSSRAQDDRAALQVGAPTVATVRVEDGVSLLHAVRKADPSGKVALAAEEDDSPGATGADRVVAVDTARIDAVSTWRTAWQGVPVSTLRPGGQRDLVLHGTRISITFAGVRNGRTYDLPSGHDLHLDLVVAHAAGWTSVPVGGIHAGTVSATIPCADGCRVVSLNLSDTRSVFPAPWGAIFAISRISTDVETPSQIAPWLDGDRWRNRLATATDPSLPVRAFAASLPGRLIVDAQDSGGAATAQLEPASGPAALPAIAGARSDLSPFAGQARTVFGTDLANQPLLLRVEGRAPAIPRALTDGVVVDLGQLERYSDPTEGAPTKEVWLAAGEHPAVLAALAREGVHVIGSATAAGAQDAARRTLVPRSVGLIRITAAVGLALALLALIAAWAIDVPVRRREWRALRLSGIPPSALRRIAAVRFAGPAAVAAVIGVPVAALTFAITVRQLPLLAGETPGPPIDVAPPWLELALLVVGLIVAAVVIGAVGARIELRRRVR